jgi:type IV pilus assembly protein PilM
MEVRFMASGAAWGIDIGQCALKAMRCRAHDDSKKVVADAFDYIEYPKILSQASGTDPADMVSDALKQFLSRNSVIGDRVAVSVSGQAGLARFIKLPPVESKKIPDIVRYEARQQIPFDLNDVVWDYQRMGGENVEEGFALETEIGLFAMKRDAVNRALDPFTKLDIDVDIVQLTPLVLYNFLLFDQIGELPPPEEFDPENPPESIVIISMGTDATDLVITNGFRVWQRSIPLGGSHFTKALIRELKLTFAKAEHLKRNATAASDPKAVFQAMKPIFSDFLTELQRSIGYFSNLDRAAKIGRVVALGNAMKLPGLRRYLSQSLGYEIEKIESYRCLEGAQVVTAPTFQENLLSFGVSYGLALQGLGKAGVHTNLLPKEIIQGRLINRKKPWALAAAALILLGCTISYASYSMSLGGVVGDAWTQAQNGARDLKQKSGSLTSEDSAARSAFQDTDKIGKNLVLNVEGRTRWLELLKAVYKCLPVEPAADPPKSIADRTELHVVSLDCEQVSDPAAWYTSVKNWDEADQAAGGTATNGASAGESSGTPAGDASQGSAANRPVWIIQLTGHHWHNSDPNNMGATFVQNTLIKSLRNANIQLPLGEDGKMESVTMKELGISHPVLINPLNVYRQEVRDPNLVGRDDAGGAPIPGHAARAADDSSATSITLQRFDFVVQFCWRPTTPQERRDARKALEKKAAETQNQQQ